MKQKNVNIGEGKQKNVEYFTDLPENLLEIGHGKTGVGLFIENPSITYFKQIFQTNIHTIQ